VRGVAWSQCFDKVNNSGGLFVEYVNVFLKLKQGSSGYPSWVYSEDDKDKYIEVYRRAEGIALDKASISKHAGQRTLAKLKLNSVLANGHKTRARPREPLLPQRKSFITS